MLSKLRFNKTKINKNIYTNLLQTKISTINFHTTLINEYSIKKIENKSIKNIIKKNNHKTNKKYNTNNKMGSTQSNQSKVTNFNELSKATNFSESSNVLMNKLATIMEKESVCSPMSIAFILSLLHFGATENTEKQLTDLLTTKNTLTDLEKIFEMFNNDVVKMANAIIVNKDLPVKEEYLNLVGKLALISNDDFSDVSNIVTKANNFIESNTNGLIKNIVKEEMICMDTIMILINTLYFKAPWLTQFMKYMTNQKSFNDNKMVNMMHNTEYFPYHEDDMVQVLEMPYKNRDYCMGFILPKQNNVEVCHPYLMNNKEYSWEYVDVSVPKFQQRKNIDLTGYLQKLGVTDIFGGESKLQNMTLMQAFISTMIHEAVVIVDENGTEAAAVTVAVCMKESMCTRNDPEPKIFNANHSFVYYIKHKPTNTLMFVGDYHGN